MGLPVEPRSLCIWDGAGIYLIWLAPNVLVSTRCNAAFLASIYDGQGLIETYSKVIGIYVQSYGIFCLN